MLNPSQKEPETTAVGAIPFPDEISHLAQIENMLDGDIRIADQAVSGHDDAYMETKRYMVEHRGDIDPHEMFQNELLLKQIDRTGAFSVQVRNRLNKLRESPYFARIDFFEGNGETISFYIGQFAYLHDGELFISDWRSPVAGMFYDFEIGPAWYLAPSGKVHGEMTRRRQFKIRGGMMEYALESSVNIQDDILQRELSHTSDEKMKSIIATIQKEQNRIIRNETAATLVIQGVAGSGKTSIALHRIAYLLYRFQKRLTAKNVAIVSPSKVFGSFIADVLPELGEEPAQELSFADIAEEQLGGTVRFIPDTDPLEVDDPLFFERSRYKASPAILEDLDRFIDHMAEQVFEPVDYLYGVVRITREWIRAQYGSYKALPVLRRIQAVSEEIRARLDAENYLGEALPSIAKIQTALTRMLKVKNSLGLYKDFYRRNGKAHLLRSPAKNTLEWADVFPYLYLRADYKGLKENREIRHLLIDEMQDYTPVQFAVINRIYKCPKTILGDFGQAVNPCLNHTLHDLAALYPDAEMIELNKSYRSTYEIISFARRFHKGGAIEAVKRHGEKPAILHCRDRGEELGAIRSKIAAFLAGENATLGIILKTDRDARKLYDSLSGVFNAHLISRDASEFRAGISITSVRMSKGLEFDEVLIPEVSAESYRSDFDQSLLYVACTRAMHMLTLTYSGVPSGYIANSEATGIPELRSE